jgi:2-C-methyl-D-erythritol 4-phosphate cytidylyltransferase
MAEKIGVAVHTVAGEEAALKITRPLDLAIAEFLLNAATSPAEWHRR